MTSAVMNFSAEEALFLDSGISRLLLLDYIEQCSVKPVCINPLHCVPKRNNSFRLITYLRRLNSHSKVPHYRNEEIRDRLNL